MTDADEITAGYSFALSRAHAINEYAALEATLAFLFSALLKTEHQKAYLVFSKVLSTSSRRQMLRELLEIEHPKKYTKFFSSLMNHQSKIDEKRNNLIHWVVKTSKTGGKPFDRERDVALHQHPNIFATGRMRKSEVDTFSLKVNFFYHLTFFFTTYLTHGEIDVPAGKQPWRDIFQRPVQYPPPEDHPLSRTD